MNLKKNAKVIEMKEEALHLYHHGEQNVYQIAQQLGKSPRTVYRWLQNTLKPHSPKKTDHPSGRPRHKKIAETIYARVLELKQENPRRSAEKIQSLLRQEKVPYLPSETSIRRFLVFKGMGRVAGESRQGYIVFEREKPNKLWQIECDTMLFDQMQDVMPRIIN